MESLWQDVRYGVRMLVKRPGFAAVAIITLALGIGANTAIFSVVNALLLRPLPFPEPDRLVMVWQTNPQSGFLQNPSSFPSFVDWREHTQSFQGLAAWNSSTQTRFNLSSGDEPEQIQYALVSSNFFSVLGVEPLLGRAFQPEEDRLDAPRVAVISHSLWQRRFGSDSNLIGKTISLDGDSFTVIGVMPAHLRFPRFPKDAEVWITHAYDPVRGRKFSPGTRYLNVIARLKSGVTITQAQAEMDIIARRQAEQDPQFYKDLGVQVVSLSKQIVGGIRQGLLVLLGAVSFVLLIACANVANLLLARSASRQKEISIRAALGADRRRLVRLLLAESVLLSLVGGTAGLLLALWGVDLLAVIPYHVASYYTPYYTPPNELGLDRWVLGFTLVLSLVTGVLFGLAPALQASKPDLHESLKEGGAKMSAGFHRQRLRSALIIGEVALSLVLLVGAGLMIKSLLRLQEVELGFKPENVLTAEISLPRSKYGESRQVAAFYGRLLDRLKTLPGVRSVGMTSLLPLSGTDANTGLFIEGQPPLPPRERPRAHNRVVSADYFSALSVPLRQGRFFTDADNDQSRRVAIINETLARRLWPGENPIGKRIALDLESYRYFMDKPPELDIAAGLREIIGVVGDIRHGGFEDEPKPEMYVPHTQYPSREMIVVMRTASGPLGLAGALRTEVFAVDKDQPVSQIRTMEQLIANVVAKPRFNFLLLGLFAALALVLAAVGMYGVISYSVTERTHEIGIRMALGAGRGEILKMVVGQGLILTLIGVGIGLAAALALTRLMTSLLYKVSATDPAMFAIVALVLTGVALLASYIPARRATKVDPMVALRYE